MAIDGRRIVKRGHADRVPGLATEHFENRNGWKFTAKSPDYGCSWVLRRRRQAILTMFVLLKIPKFP
jgi:hypothetical protein